MGRAARVRAVSAGAAGAERAAEAGGRASLCFVALHAHPVLLGTGGTHGGAEVQQTLLARALAARSYRVSVICLDHGGPRDLVHDGIRVITCYRRTAGIPGTRFLPRAIALWRAMDRARADVYLHQCAGPIVGLIAAFTRARGKRFVFQTASAGDVDGDYLRCANPRDRWLYGWGVRRADAVIVQAEEHRSELRGRFGREGTVIVNGHPLPPRPARMGEGRFVLWVGMVRPVKGPERFLELAALLPQTRFVLIGGNDMDPGYVERLRAGAAALPNVEMWGPRSRDEVLAVLPEALCLVNTSDHEGFPNTFIEAWSMGVPVVSLRNDPDGRIARFGLGYVAESLEEMAHRIAAMEESDVGRRALCARCRDYVEAEHDLDKIVLRYEGVFRSVLSGPGR
jgi:glycosyltransferase involved in cell wall biosynthesis